MRTIKVDNAVFHDHDASVTAYESATDERWAFVIRVASETPAFVVITGGRQGIFVAELGSPYESDSDQDAISEAIRIRVGN
jgi:roadblock/LC7 domain-containing protein